MASEVFGIAVVILAAGASSRMGRPKMLLPWGSTSVIGHLIEQWKPFAAQTGVVCAECDQDLARELDRVGFPMAGRIGNPNRERGMFSSIQCAARWDGWRPDVSHWVLSLGDQPHLRTSTLEALIDFSSEHPNAICQPSRHGRARHPVILPKAAWTALARSGCENLKQFLHESGFERVSQEIEDAGLDLDLDHPEDYEQALKRFFPVGQRE